MDTNCLTTFGTAKSRFGTSIEYCRLSYRNYTLSCKDRKVETGDRLDQYTEGKQRRCYKQLYILRNRSFVDSRKKR